MDKTFSQLMKELETIVTNLENNDLELEAALSEFEKGIQIFRSCQGKLKEVENKTKQLIEENGDFFIKEME
ncbi:MAG: exodeoxyribonuclease VII small subunit [Fusobacteria bacterium]|nr:exodeoxyribonuclease VII small subunit [Fusobacteriota bacterium]